MNAGTTVTEAALDAFTQLKNFSNSKDNAVSHVILTVNKEKNSVEHEKTVKVSELVALAEAYAATPQGASEKAAWDAEHAGESGDIAMIRWFQTIQFAWDLKGLVFENGQVSLKGHNEPRLSVLDIRYKKQSGAEVSRMALVHWNYDKAGMRLKFLYSSAIDPLKAATGLDTAVTASDDDELTFSSLLEKIDKNAK